MRVFKLLKEVGKDFVKGFIIPCIVSATIGSTIAVILNLLYGNISKNTKEILYSIVVYGGISVLIILLIVFGIKSLIKYIKKKWNEVNTED